MAPKLNKQEFSDLMDSIVGWASLPTKSNKF